MLVLDTALFVNIFAIRGRCYLLLQLSQCPRKAVYNNHIPKFFNVLEHPSPLAYYVMAKNMLKIFNSTNK